MTDTQAALVAPVEPAPAGGGSLAGMLLPELKRLAGSLGISGVSGMRKAELISAISTRQNGGNSGGGGGSAASSSDADRPPTVHRLDSGADSGDESGPRQHADSARAGDETSRSEAAEEPSQPERTRTGVDRTGQRGHGTGRS